METIQEKLKRRINFNFRKTCTFGPKNIIAGAPVQLKVEGSLFDREGKYVFRASGDLVIRKSSKLGLVCPVELGGQMLDDGVRYLAKNGLRCDGLEKLVPLWKEWHNNDLTAGTAAQEKVLDDYRKSHPDEPYDYDIACKVLSESGLLVDHDVIIDGKPYRYASKWLIRKIPEEVLVKIVDVFHNGNFEILKTGGKEDEGSQKEF